MSYTGGTIRKNVEFDNFNSNVYSFDLGYSEGTHFKLKYNDVAYDFDFTIDDESTTNGIPYYDHNFAQNLKLRWLIKNNKSRLQLLDNNIIQYFELISIAYPFPDEFALKSELNETTNILDTYTRYHKDLEILVGEQIVRINELNTQISKLETENTTLKAQLAAVKPIYPWTSYYEGFDERVEFINNYHVIRTINYIYSSPPGNISVNVNISYIGNYEYLLIILNKDRSLSYIRLNPNDRCAYLNEISGGTLYSSYSTGVFPLALGTTLDVTSPSSTMLAFDYIFRKPAAV